MFDLNATIAGGPIPAPGPAGLKESPRPLIGTTLPSPILWANSDRFTAPHDDDEVEVGQGVFILHRGPQRGVMLLMKRA